MRVFCRAKQFPGVNIDENLVCDSVTWLIQNQRGDGALHEVHQVIHKEMVVSKLISMALDFLISAIQLRPKFRIIGSFGNKH